MSVLTLVAPITGVVTPLRAVPDPAFASGTVGQGVAVDPLDAVLVAPCDAVVRHIHRARHAVTLDAGGVEILLHVGVDTVRLEGRGFTALVDAGRSVRAGTPLLRLDIDVIAQGAASLLTSCVVLTPGVEVEPFVGGTHCRAGTDALLRIRLPETAVAVAGGAKEVGPSSSAPDVQTRTVIVRESSGLHARPAALLATIARGFEAELRLAKGARAVDVRSVVGLLTLEAACGDALTLTAAGADAEAALDAVAGWFGGATPYTMTSRAPILTGTLRGIAAAPGLAVGAVRQWAAEAPVRPRRTEDATGERRRLEAATATAGIELETLRDRLIAEGHAARARIFDAHLALLRDPELVSEAEDRLLEGFAAEWAWWSTCAAQAERLRGLRDATLATRATDLRDVGRRVTRLLGEGEASVDALAALAGLIVVAEDLTPSEVVDLGRAGVVGLCMTSGGANAHAAILARGLGLPTVVGIDPAVLGVPDGVEAILDAGTGTLQLAPGAEACEAVHARQQRAQARHAADLAAAHAPSVTQDGQHVPVLANVGDADGSGARRALAAGAEGIGLFRSEFAFEHRAESPTEAEQVASYSAAAGGIGVGRPVVIRLLDVGGDKPLPYLPMPIEANPFLGERGLRFLFTHETVLRTQLRAVLRAAAAGPVALLLPMVTTLDELTRVRALVEAERVALGAPAIPVGVMIETPAAALLADRLAASADFLSIGTNDLTQYALAMDRTHPRLAAQADALHPAVLRLIAQTVEGARQHRRPVTVCGALAGDLAAVPLLLGLGVEELSVDVPLIAAVKARVRGLTLADCRVTAQAALACADATEVRALAAARHGEES
ncbi:MAG: phosphoenolpyruvate--protein phosphotransferase [Gemmatimonadota bacterium]